MIDNKKQKLWRDQPISAHFGSLEALIFFLIKHEEREVCLKSIVSPSLGLHGESVRHYGVCASACLYEKPGMPIAYATFLAGSGAWLGQHARVLYPKFAAHDPLQQLPVAEAIANLQQALFVQIQRTLQANLAFSVVVDAQWDVINVWTCLAKGFAWQDGAWTVQPSTPSSVFP